MTGQEIQANYHVTSPDMKLRVTFNHFSLEIHWFLAGTRQSVTVYGCHTSVVPLVSVMSVMSLVSLASLVSLVSLMSLWHQGATLWHVKISTYYNSAENHGENLQKQNLLQSVYSSSLNLAWRFGSGRGRSESLLCQSRSLKRSGRSYICSRRSFLDGDPK